MTLVCFGTLQWNTARSAKILTWPLPRLNLGGQIGIAVSFLSFQLQDTGSSTAEGTTLIAFSVPNWLCKFSLPLGDFLPYWNPKPPFHLSVQILANTKINFAFLRILVFSTRLIKNQKPKRLEYPSGSPWYWGHRLLSSLFIIFSWWLQHDRDRAIVLNMDLHVSTKLSICHDKKKLFFKNFWKTKLLQRELFLAMF